MVAWLAKLIISSNYKFTISFCDATSQLQPHAVAPATNQLQPHAVACSGACSARMHARTAAHQKLKRQRACSSGNSSEDFVI